MLIEGMEQNLSDVASVPDSDNDLIFNVYGDPVMKSALDVLEKLGKNNKVILRAKGNSIPNAVAIANIVTEKMLKDSSEIQKISVDSDEVKGLGKTLSKIEIILIKKS